MRSGGCAVNQALNTEAASLVKQAVALAKRRGHAQVTPLHVANVMLAVSGGVLRAACMQSHSHPLQCKALELCFNVALNRLPASSSHAQYPCISNALVAAFKRAQAHQRRGSAESQPQPILAVKIELEQLVVSILDDPSVSRVMREAGFSSTQVKTNVVSLELIMSSHLSKNSKVVDPSSPAANDDLQTLVETLLMSGKKRSFVVVGESISDIESRVKELMDRVDKGGVPEGLKEVKFITIPPFYSFCNLDKELVEHKMGELAFLVKNLVGKAAGVVLYLGDLNWVTEYRANLERGGYYCSVEHMIMEIGKLISEIGEIGRFWIMGIATFQTYIRCKNGYNSLQSIWRLNPVTIPANTLGLSLISQSSNEYTGAREVTLTCCPDCWSKFEAEAENIQNHEPTLLSSSSSLPPWLKDESRRLCNINNQKNNEYSSSIVELRKKWNTYCASSSHTATSSSTSFDQHNTNLSLSKPDSNSPTSSDDVVDTHKFKEFNAVNLNILCNALGKKVPWQREIIPEIAGTLLQCRSGMVRRKVNDLDACKEDTWLLFLGPDSLAKHKIATHLARIVFGSSSNVAPIGCDYIDKFGDAVSENPHRVFLVEGLEKAGYWSQIRVKRAIESGRIMNGSGEEVSFCDAIVVLSCERFSCRSTPESSPGKVAGAGDEDTSTRIFLDLNCSFDDDDDDQNQFIDDLGILENVDRLVVFKIQNI